MGGRLRLYEVQVQVEGRDVARAMVVKVVKAKVVTCRVGQSETRVPRIATACRVCRVRRWETCEHTRNNLLNLVLGLFNRGTSATTVTGVTPLLAN